MNKNTTTKQGVSQSACEAEETTPWFSVMGPQMMIVGNVWVFVCAYGGGGMELCIIPLSLSPSLYPSTFPFLCLPPMAVLMGHNLSFAHCSNWCTWGEVHVFSSPSASVRELENGILWRAVCVCLSSSKMTHFHYSLWDRTDFSVLWPSAYIMICSSEDNLYCD